MTMELFITIGFAAGLAVSLLTRGVVRGCLGLLAVPLLTFAYIWIWQSLNPEKLRSTGALDFVFGPIWPSFGAIVGFGVGELVRFLSTAKHWGLASIFNSLMLLAAAALQWDATFWALVMTNFALMHAVWLVQLARHKNWRAVDVSLLKWPLLAFAVMGNAALLLWGDRLLAVFSA